MVWPSVRGAIRATHFCVPQPKNAAAQNCLLIRQPFGQRFCLSFAKGRAPFAHCSENCSLSKWLINELKCHNLNLRVLYSQFSIVAPALPKWLHNCHRGCINVDLLEVCFLQSIDMKSIPNKQKKFTPVSWVQHSRPAVRWHLYSGPQVLASLALRLFRVQKRHAAIKTAYVRTRIGHCRCGFGYWFPSTSNFFRRLALWALCCELGYKTAKIRASQAVQFYCLGRWVGVECDCGFGLVIYY